MLVCLVRLWFLQTFDAEPSREQIQKLRILPPRQLPTLRGKILDRNGSILAKDDPFFYLQVNYELTRLLDPRFWEGKVQQFVKSGLDEKTAEEKLAVKWQDDLAEIRQIQDFCLYTAGLNRDEFETKINEINDRIWELGRFISWRRTNPKADIRQYSLQRNDIRAAQIVDVDLSDMHKTYSLLELKDRQILMAAQIDLAHIRRAVINSESKRVYAFDSAASQIIGWVGPVKQEEADTLFNDDEYLRYLEEDIIGKLGIEKICEIILRGKRGEVTYDKDRNQIQRTDPQFGQDIQLSIDIHLQKDMETLLSDPNAAAPGFGGNGKLAAVVIDAATGDILAMVSIPLFDLNQARQNYNKLLNDPDRPLQHRAMEETFPPGSSVKPLILLAGLEEHKVAANEVIHCSWTMPPASWPKCLLQRKGYCHDSRWDEEGQVNNGRNALRGSCNVYFSRLADRLDSKDLQQWLWFFGWGTEVLQPCVNQTVLNRLQITQDINLKMRESPGSIIFGIQQKPILDITTAPVIPASEKRWWGIGQGNLRVTALQVANAYAALARRGVYKPPRLIIDPDDPSNEKHNRQIPLHQENLDVIYDGMHAVVYERGGTAHEAFVSKSLDNPDITIYGKTGSTEKPYNAWFASFVTDRAGRAISLAIVAEEGQSGAKDAAPLGMEIIRLCHQAGFIGTKTAAAEK